MPSCRQNSLWSQGWPPAPAPPACVSQAPRLQALSTMLGLDLSLLKQLPKCGDYTEDLPSLALSAEFLKFKTVSNSQVPERNSSRVAQTWIKQKWLVETKYSCAGGCAAVRSNKAHRGGEFTQVLFEHGGDHVSSLWWGWASQSHTIG